MSEMRYRCVQQGNGTWSVIDTVTERASQIGLNEASMLTHEDAIEMAEMLNMMPLSPYRDHLRRE